MGEIIRITCKNCNAEWQCNTGCGVMHATIENVIHFFPEEMRVLIGEEAEQTEMPIFTFAYKPAYCKQCAGIVSVPVLDFPESDKTFYGRCAQCDQNVEVMDELQAQPCPECGEAALEKRRVGFWD